MKFSLFLLFLLFSACANNQKPQDIKLLNPYYEKAYQYRVNNKTDSAFIYYNKAKDLFLKRNDSLGIGKCLVNMAIISTDNGDYFGGQEIGLDALSFLDKKNQDHFIFIKSNFNNLGIATYQLRDYRGALKFYDSAIVFSKVSSDTYTYLNNIGKAYQELKEYQEALKIFSSILERVSQTSEEYPRVVTNYAITKWLQNPNYKAAPELLRGLNIRKKNNDLRGQNSSFSHLSDYYRKTRPDSALLYALQMYQVSIKINNPDAQLDALGKLIRLSPYSQQKYYFETYQQLNDSVQTARSAAKNQFALIRYESEKHKADFLNAQAENVQKQNNIFRQNIILALLATSLVLGYFWYRKRKKGLQQEKELEVKNIELKYVRKIHDRVANKVYHVMSEVENTEELNKDALLDQLEGLYNVSRDISYDSKDPNIEGNFTQHLTNMLKTHSSEIVNISIIGNKKSLWEKVNSTSKSEIFYVLQELLTNMSKHSKANHVIIKFSRPANHIKIHYTDNGIGISGAPQSKNGLNNTETRIKNISGTITFDTKVEKGLAIHISFPVS